MSDRSWIATKSQRDAHYRRRAEEMSRGDRVEIEVHLHHATPKAVLISDDGDEDSAVWLPRSKIVVDESAEIGETTKIEVPEWLAQEHGLI